MSDKVTADYVRKNADKLAEWLRQDHNAEAFRGWMHLKKIARMQEIEGSKS